MARSCCEPASWPAAQGGVSHHVNVVTSKAVGAIDWYRREVSPHKGFSCAYRVQWGGRSCAGVVRAALINDGLFAGVRAAARQPFWCYEASRLLAEQSEPEKKDAEPKLKKTDDTAACIALDVASNCCWLPALGS